MVILLGGSSAFGSTNGDHYELGNYNVDGSNLNTYPAVYRGILNFFGDIWTFIRDVAIINRNVNYNSVYLLKKVLIILILQ